MALAFQNTNFSVSKLNIKIPVPLEAVWALMRPHKPTGYITKIILCSFYSPPNSKKNNQLIEHLISTLNHLRIQHKNAPVIMMADVNNLKVEKLLALDPSLKSVNMAKTRGDKCLDRVITDIYRFYQLLSILPPISVDEGEMGVPSDHSGVQFLPKDGVCDSSSKKEHITVRPMPKSLIEQFGRVLLHEDWSCMNPTMSSTQMVKSLETQCASHIDSVFPLKSITVRQGDSPFMTEELRKLKVSRKRDYRKRG